MNLRVRLLAVALTSVLAWQSTSAAPAGLNPDKLATIDNAITSTIAEKNIPGAVFWMERKDESYHRAYGHRAVAPEFEPMSENTIFDAASLTKVLAGTPAVMLLVERGKIDLDASVAKYLPEFGVGGKEAITVRQLLNHTSGLRPDVNTRPPWSGSDTALRLACEEKLQAKPGTVFRYSDINLFVAGFVAERASGRSLNEFVRDEIYRPLGMSDTGYLPPADKLTRVAPTELTDGRMLRGVVHDPTARFMGGVAGHAGIFTTAHDVARFARMMLNGGELDGVRVFKPATVALMTSVQTPTNIVPRRGLGWDIDSGYSRPRGKIFPLGSYGHTGFTGTALWIDPFSKTFWILLSNRVHPDGKGNVLPLQATLGTLVAEAVEGFDFANVAGALPARTNWFVSSTNASTATNRPVIKPQALKVAIPNFPGVLNGIDVLVKQNFAPLKKKRVGLITNHTGMDRWRNPTIDLLFRAPEVQLKALFSPEHGIRGEQDEKVDDGTDAQTGLPVFSLYGVRRTPAPEQLQGIDVLVFDIQDIGCRFYTYAGTLANCMEAAAKAGVKFLVLDRINPINGLAVEGPIYDGEPAFVAWHSVPLRHGMTVGELARMFNAEKKFGADLAVIPVEGWHRRDWFDAAALPWRNPSPNMKSLAGAILYPGVGLHESALCVGRGTDKPFELVAAPYIDDMLLAAELNKAGLPGVRFLPIRITPTYSTFKDKECGGAVIIITDRDKLDAVDVGITIALTLRRLYPNEYALDKISHLLRHAPTQAAIQAGRPLKEIKESWAAELREFKKRRAAFLIYK